MSKNLIRKISKLRKELDDYHNKGLLKSIDNSKSKLYIGKLSKGCLTCVEGKWACIFINGKCTRSCFFCPQDRRISKERKPYLDGIYFDKVNDCIDFLKKYKFQGVGFTGGEPLLVFDLLLSYIDRIRKEFKNSIYIWMYTNGDLISEEKLYKLRKAGLDEIRFDISARLYDLAPIMLAKKIMKNVVIETPSIPEDLSMMLHILSEFPDLRINQINLHELMKSGFNAKAFAQRGYISKDNSGIINSDYSGLSTLKHCLNNKIGININYCTSQYKRQYQQRGINFRYSSDIKEKYETITSTGYIRQIYFTPSRKWFSQYGELIRIKPYIHFDKSLNRIYVKPNLLSTNDFSIFNNQKISIVYYYPRLINKALRKKGFKKIKINNNFSINGYKGKFKTIHIQNINYLQAFNNLFIKSMNIAQTFKNINNTDSDGLIKSSAEYFEKTIIGLITFHKLFQTAEYYS